MPIVSIVARSDVFVMMHVHVFRRANNNGVEFFVESEPEQATVYVRARGNLSIDRKGRDGTPKP